jgi:hypothetical protein
MGRKPRALVLVVILLATALFPVRGACQVSADGDRGGEEASPYPVDPEAVARPSARATRTELPVVLDGSLDEAAWKGAEPISGFIQAVPDAGYPATEETVVRVLYDDERLYVGALLLDSHPEGIIAQYLNQDFQTHDDDVFAVTLDTFLDRRNSFMFLINPHGAVKDGQTFDNSRTLNLAWEGVIEVETSVHARGWTVELAIPFTTLRFDPNREDQSWGIQFLRRVRRKNEDSYWAPVDRRSRVHSMAFAGTLEGLRGLPRPRNLSLKPYAKASTSSGEMVSGSAPVRASDAGLDLKYGITPRLTLDLTYNTDFSQVEVDREQVNLTRFSLFFPEKRDFFMENSGLFAFGDLSERNYRLGASPRDFTLFHSRRIGLVGGRPVPIVAGGRLTGRVAGLDVGMLNMQTEASGGLRAETFSVARVRRTFGSGLQVGGILTHRNDLGSSSSAYNTAYGVDANYALAGKLLVHSYLARTAYPGREGNARAARLSAAWRDRFWNVSGLVREVGDAFDPGLGFVARRGIRHGYGTVGIHPRPSVSWITEVNPWVETHYITDLSSSLETRESTGGVGVLFLDGGRLNVEASDRFEDVDEVFLVAGQGEVPPGRYDFREGSLSYAASAARPLSGEIRLSGGGFFHGDRRSVTLRGNWRPSHHFAVDIRAQHNEITFPDQTFTADVFGARLDFARSTRFFASAFLQYNAASEEAVTNVRLNFIHSPLSDLFLVYSERRNVDADLLLERSIAIKGTKLLSF